MVINGMMMGFVYEVESYLICSIYYYLVSGIVFSMAGINSTGPSRPDLRNGISFQGFPRVPEAVMFVRQ